MTDLSQQHCQAIADGTPALSGADADSYLQQLNKAWDISENGKAIHRTYPFSNYYQTMAFANVAAMVAHQQDHHPEMTISYNRCHVVYSTHSINGLSLNDFICAAKTDRALCL